MLEALAGVFTNRDLMPHGMCFLWDPGLLWLHAISDTLIAAAYYGIPVVIAYFAIKRKDLVFRHIFILSGLFVLACGTTHVLNVWVLWNPDYGVEGAVKAATAAVSLTSLAAIWRVMPMALAFPSPSQLREANTALEKEIVERRRAEAEITKMNRDLEARVAKRTTEIEDANAALRQQVEREQLLVREIHHRVKNNLQTMSSMLRLQADTAGAELAPQFATAQRRIQVMAQIHEELYQAEKVESVDFAAYLENLCADIGNFYEMDDRVTLAVSAEPLNLNLDQATALALVANEAITNACAHAFPDERTGTITVSLHHSGTDAELTVADDGIGLSARDMNASKGDSMGSLIMAALSEQIAGYHDIASDHGTRVTIRFPVTKGGGRG
jgi:two-component sensor histidine kinase